ncbi:MAG: flagellar brake protein [bacterium]
MTENKQSPTGVQPDELDRFLTQRKSEVVSSLLELSRTIEPLTILFDSGKHSFPTSIIALDSDDTEVVFEPAASDEMNARLLRHKKGTVIGQPDGIRVRFLLEPITAAEYKGEKVLVAPLPKEHYRMQRRQLFRIDTLINDPVTVTLRLTTGEQVTLTVGNISSGGLRLDDADHVLECESGEVLKDCSLHIPDLEPFLIDLVVHNCYEKKKKSGTLAHYVGCGFQNLRPNHELDIQKYINGLQRARSAVAR